MGQCIGRLLGHVMPAINRAVAQIAGPWPPQGKHVAIEADEIVLRCPETK